MSRCWLVLVLHGACAARVRETIGEAFAAQHRVSEERVKEVCSVEQMKAAGEALDLKEQNASAAQIAQFLDVTHEQVSELLFSTLKLSQPINLESLCRAAVEATPRVLGRLVPKPKMACLDERCAEEVSVDLEELLKSPPLQPDGDPEDTPKVLDESPRMPRVEENSLPDIMTNLLNELFDVFPAPFDVEASDAFDGHFQSSLAERSSYPPGFGPMHPGSPAIEESILEERRKAYKKELVQAVAWVSAAVQKKRARIFTLDCLKTWMKGSEHSKVIFQHLQHVKKVLQNSYIRKSPDPGVYCAKRELAYVQWHPLLGQQRPGPKDHRVGEMTKDDRYIINLCPAFWAEGSQFRIGALIHEASHHYGTTDHAYGAEACRALPADKALENADSYFYLVQNLNDFDSTRVTWETQLPGPKFTSKLMEKIKRAEIAAKAQQDALKEEAPEVQKGQDGQVGEAP
ncbi:unnamed protein product [Durusdinium trenchii]|uniref:Lysine-specific metallo-endopeptidase domain-containing protein n=1 Tax=Durusdinium trenchii TaxID=1381693 RepID=A0ABP0L2D6_9DINO